MFLVEFIIMNIQTTINYITDEQGKKRAVVIPYQSWINFKSEYDKLFQKESITKEIKESILEVRKTQKEGKELQ